MTISPINAIHSPTRVNRSCAHAPRNCRTYPLRTRPEKYWILKEKLTEFKELEQVLVFFSENNSSDLNALLGNTKFTFPLFTKLNKNKGAISALNMYYLINPFFSIISPIVLFVLTYLFAVLLLQIHQNDGVFSVPQLDLFKRGMLRGFFTLFMFIYSLYSSSILSYINYNLFKKEYEYIQEL